MRAPESSKGSAWCSSSSACQLDDAAHLLRRSMLLRALVQQLGHLARLRLAEALRILELELQGLARVASWEPVPKISSCGVV